MKLTFRQRTYILVLALFLAGLFLGILSLTVFSYGKNLKEKETACRAECSYIASCFERDSASLEEYGRGTDITLLMASYSDHYKKQNTFLCFKNKDEILYSAFLHDTPTVESDRLMYQDIDGGKSILISVQICGGNYQLLYAKSIEDTVASFHRLTVIYISVAVGISVVVAILLQIILKKLTMPLEKLKRTAEDITNGKKGIRADERGTDEFSALAGSFNKMLDALKYQVEISEKQAEQKQMLVDNLAHELRTPLTTIKGYISYCTAATVSEEERTDALLTALSETDRLSKISEKILDGAYLEHNGITVKPVELSLLISETQKKLSYIACQKDVKIETELHNTVVEGDEDLLSVLFYNLIENAIKACKNGGTVHLRCNNGNAYVEDDGRGMTEEQLSHVTEPFYCTDKSRSRAEGGAGLGLSLCRQIIEAHKGEMHFESKPDKGTKIFLHFVIWK